MDEIEKIQKENEKYLRIFRRHLQDKGLKKETIDNHVGNVCFYISEYLMNYIPKKMQEGCGYHFDSFIRDVIIRKTIPASVRLIDEYCTSIRRFYRCMKENGYVDDEAFAELCWYIKESKDEWVEDFYHENPKVIYVADIVEALESVDDFSLDYLDTETAKIIRLPSDEGFMVDEDEDLLDAIESDDGRYVCLPSQHDLNEYAIMEEFAMLQKDEIKEKLFCVLKRRKPFRGFKDEIIYLGIANDYYRFRREKFRDIAIKFLEENGIQYSLENKSNGIDCR